VLVSFPKIGGGQISFKSTMLFGYPAIVSFCSSFNLSFQGQDPYLVVMPDLTSNNSCEVFFSKLGGMKGHERAYDFHELVNTANTLKDGYIQKNNIMRWRMCGKHFISCNLEKNNVIFEC
jgi:hypothetical protein